MREHIIFQNIIYYDTIINHEYNSFSFCFFLCLSYFLKLKTLMLDKQFFSITIIFLRHYLKYFLIR